MKNGTFILTATLFFLLGCGAKPSYIADQNGLSPDLINAIATKNFYELPLQGEVADRSKFWSGDYWAHRKGNINLRWNSYDPMGFDLYSPSAVEAPTWAEADFAWLSPAEKYDLFTGNYNYPLKNDVYSHANPSAEYWEGICDGWAPASMNHREPRPKVMTNPDGLRIPFGSSDIKALISYYYAFNHQVGTSQEGRRCPRRTRIFNWNPDCREDLNAGTFHLVLTNKVGRERKGFIADIKPLNEVWNHPIFSYKSEILNTEGARRNSPAGTQKTMVIRTALKYIDESDKNTWDPLIGTEYQIMGNLTYEYTVDLDSGGNVIGGDWISTERPDFIWTKEAPKSYTGILSRLGELMND